MKFRYAPQWAFIDFLVALAMALSAYVGLKPEWWGWLLFSPLFIYMVFEGVRKVRYTLTVDDDLITVGSFKIAQYSVSKIKALHVWDAKGGRIAVVDLDDGKRFNFSSRVGRFDYLVSLLRTKANLPNLSES
jgi:hypothetical protein